MPRAVILTALPVEYLAVHTHLTNPQDETHPQGTVYERGQFAAGSQTWEVGLVEIGAGNPSAALEAERAIAYFDPDVILFVGVAGGIKDVALGDVVASTKVYGYESGKAGETFRPRPEVGLSAYGLEQRARAEAKKTDWLQRLSALPSSPPKVYVAPIAAGEKVVASTESEVFKFLRSNYGDAIAVEMEGFGFLDAARANQQVSALVVRGISDLIYNKTEADNQGYQEIAARHASAFAFEVLAKLKPSDRGLIHTTSKQTNYQVSLQSAQNASEVGMVTEGLLEENPTFFLPDNLPNKYVERIEAMALLKQELLSKNKLIGLIGSMALHGQGGIGKTVLARAICEDTDIIQAFPDGILWATLGQESEPIIHQRAWIKKLGGDISAASSLESSKVELRRLLNDKAMLLVLDDVWDFRDLKLFQVEGSRCKTLITTRDATQVDGAVLVPLTPMSIIESRHLLTLASNYKVFDQDLLDVIAERLGYLPLALKIVGSMLASGISWLDIVSALDQGDMNYVSYGQTSLMSVISASVNYLPLDQQERYFELVVFPEDEVLDEVSVGRLWQQTGSLQPRHTRKLLAEFRDKGLLQVGNVLHDLQFDYLQSAVSLEKKRQIHSVLIKTYGHSPSWTNLFTSKEPYGWRRLAYHLALSDKPDQLFSLLTNFNYLETKIKLLGTATLLVDFELGDLNPLNSIADALRMGAHVLDRDPSQLYNQLYGRLGDIGCLHSIPINSSAFLRMESQTLTPPGGTSLEKLSGHVGGIKGCALSLDKRYVLSASIDSTLRVWDVNTGKTIRSLIGHKAVVNCCSFSSDGKYILSASSDGTLRVWRMDTGQTVQVLEGHGDAVNSCTFSSDGLFALSASSDCTLRLWDIKTGKTLVIFKGHEDVVRGCTLDPDCRFAFSASADKTVRVWEVTNGSAIHVLKGHIGEVTSVSFNPSRSLLVSGGYCGSVRVWDISTGEEIRCFQTHTSGVLSVAFNQDGRTIVCASWDRTLKLWDIEAKKLLRTFLDHKAGINHCVTSFDGELALSASWDSTLRLWRISTGEILQKFEGYSGRVSACAFNSNGHLALSAYEDHTINVWSVGQRKVLHTLNGHTDYVRGCSFSPDGQQILSTSEDHSLRLWDVNTGKTLRILEGHTGPVRDCAFTPDGQFALSASWDSTLRLWSIHDGKTIRVFKGHTNRVSGLAITENGEFVLSASDDKTLRLWHTSSGETLCELVGHSDYVRSCALSANGKIALSASIDGTVLLWDIEAREIQHVLKKHTAYVRHCTLNETGKLGVSVGDDCTLWVWDLEHGKPITAWYSDGALMCCAFDRKQSRVLVGDGLRNLHFLRLENL